MMRPPLPALQKLASFARPTALGIKADVHSFSHEGAILFAVGWGNLKQDNVLIRIQSPCLFGESFGVNSCDCGQQLNDALAAGAKEDAFLLIYLSNQEGRGHGMQTKIKAIEKEANEGLEMPESFRELNLALDLRSYATAASIILTLIGERPIRLLTNNPKKLDELRAYAIDAAHVPLVVKNPTAECRRYLDSKRREMGHMLPEHYD